jgi:predicted ATP-binding protein involved in virulence
MKIKEIDIKNFRGISDVKFILSDNLNVFVGVNGSGKTTVLDAIATSLSWLVNRIQRESSSGRPITESSIKNETSFSIIELTVFEQKRSFKWKLTKTAKGEAYTEKSDLAQVSELATYFQSISRQNSTLPVFAYYPINRVVNATTPEYWVKDNINILDVYDNALDGKTNYQSFFEWFRLQDDIVNEKSQSRTKWMIQNKSWVKNRTKKLLSHLKEITEREGVEFEYPRGRLFPFEKDDFIYEEPRYLFREIIDILRYSEFRNRKNFEFERTFHDLEYMLHKMGSLSDSKKDNLSEFNRFPTSIVEQIIKQICELQQNKDFETDKKAMVSFIWEALLFAVLLSLWWLSNKGKKDIEKIFNQFNPTKYKDNYRWEIESGKFIDELNKTVINDAERLDNATRNEGRELNFVTKTIENFVPSYANLRVRRIPRPHMLVDKEGVEISLDKLSDGEKNLIALVGDIARRLSIANPNSKKPLDGEGVILIDEIDLHLHPSWQRLMIPQLTKAFPNCQFIITTHSPQVLSHVHHENIFLLKNDKGDFNYSKAMESFGQSSDRILEDLLGVDSRPAEQKEMLHDIFSSIQNGDLSVAKEKVKTLIDLIGEDPEIVKANVLIKRKEIIGK